MTYVNRAADSVFGLDSALPDITANIAPIYYCKQHYVTVYSNDNLSIYISRTVEVCKNNTLLPKTNTINPIAE